MAPENTIAAFKCALRAGADGIEFDVRLTHDGVPVVIHDATLRRTGLVGGCVAELTAKELEQVDVGVWFARKRGPSAQTYAGEQIPTLKRVLNLMRNKQVLLYVELKTDADKGTELALAVTKLIREYGLADRVIVESFDLASIRAVRACAEEIRTAALFQHRWLRAVPFLKPRQMIDLALKSDASEIALHHRLVNNRAVEAALAAGLKVVVWTVDDPVWLSRARALGVNSLITNDPAGMLRHRSDLNND